ncbi:MAG: hypothetical protein ABIH56_05700, partial [Candidatus Margulisiibacteriota bacterium]
VLLSFYFIYQTNEMPAKYMSKQELLKRLEKSVSAGSNIYYITNISDKEFSIIKKDVDAIRDAGGGEKDTERYLREMIGLSHKISSQYSILPINDKASMEKIGKIIKKLYPPYNQDDQYSDYMLGNAVYEKFLSKRLCLETPTTTLVKILAYCLIWAFVWLTIFEIARRIYYYITLGKIFPPK